MGNLYSTPPSSPNRSETNYNSPSPQQSPSIHSPPSPHRLDQNVPLPELSVQDIQEFLHKYYNFQSSVQTSLQKILDTLNNLQNNKPSTSSTTRHEQPSATQTLHSSHLNNSSTPLIHHSQLHSPHSTNISHHFPSNTQPYVPNLSPTSSPNYDEDLITPSQFNPSTPNQNPTYPNLHNLQHNTPSYSATTSGQNTQSLHYSNPQQNQTHTYNQNPPSSSSTLAPPNNWPPLSSPHNPRQNLNPTFTQNSNTSTHNTSDSTYFNYQTAPKQSNIPTLNPAPSLPPSQPPIHHFLNPTTNPNNNLTLHTNTPDYADRRKAWRFTGYCKIPTCKALCAVNVVSNNAKGNIGRAYFYCGDCKKFQCWASPPLPNTQQTNILERQQHDPTARVPFPQLTYHSPGWNPPASPPADTSIENTTSITLQPRQGGSLLDAALAADFNTTDNQSNTFHDNLQHLISQQTNPDRPDPPAPTQSTQHDTTTQTQSNPPPNTSHSNNNNPDPQPSTQDSPDYDSQQDSQTSSQQPTAPDKSPPTKRSTKAKKK